MKAQHVGEASALEFMRSRRVFEINPEHPIIKSLHVCDCPQQLCVHIIYVVCFNCTVILVILQDVCQSGQEDEEALRAIDLLYDAALISSGFTVSLLPDSCLCLAPVFFQPLWLCCIVNSCVVFCNQSILV